MISERGGMFVYILVGIVLFGALMFAWARSGNQSSALMTTGAAKAAASEINGYANAVTGAVQKLVAKGCSETQISFDVPPYSVTGQYHNSNAPPDFSCHVFHPSGGKVAWRRPDQSFLDARRSAAALYGAFFYTGGTGGNQVGTSPPCDATYSNGKELIMFLPYVRKEVCRQLARSNMKLKADDPIPQDNNLSFDNRPGLTLPFRGVYGDACGFELNGLGTSYATFIGQESGCFEGEYIPSSGTYHFYRVLLVR